MRSTKNGSFMGIWGFKACEFLICEWRIETDWFWDCQRHFEWHDKHWARESSWGQWISCPPKPSKEAVDDEQQFRARWKLEEQVTFGLLAVFVPDCVWQASFFCFSFKKQKKASVLLEKQNSVSTKSVTKAKRGRERRGRRRICWCRTFGEPCR